MKKESLLEAVRELRRKAVEELSRDEELGRFFKALEKLDEIEAVAARANATATEAVEAPKG